MGLIKLIQLNMRMIRTINGCNRDEFKQLIDDVIEVPEIFRKKYFIWNIIRPRDWYKSISFWIVERCHAVQALDDYDEQMAIITEVDYVIKEVIATTKNFKIRQSFIWNIMKHVPILTVITIQYASPERIKNILNSEKMILLDDYLCPFVEEFKRAKDNANAIQDLLDGEN